MISDEIKKRLTFVIELDRLKSVVRQSPLADRSRKENSAEHSWHLAMFALAFAEQDSAVDVCRAVRMLLIHDIVEIDAGDTPIHGSSAGLAAQQEAELGAAQRIFGLLPHLQGKELFELWLEFEKGETPTAAFAKALDRFQPLLLNTLTGGGTWTESNVSEAQVIERYMPVIQRGSAALHEIAIGLVQDYFRKVPSLEG